MNYAFKSKKLTALIIKMGIKLYIWTLNRKNCSLPLTHKLSLNVFSLILVILQNVSQLHARSSRESVSFNNLFFELTAFRFQNGFPAATDRWLGLNWSQSRLAFCWRFSVEHQIACKWVFTDKTIYIYMMVFFYNWLEFFEAFTPNLFHVSLLKIANFLSYIQFFLKKIGKVVFYFLTHYQIKSKKKISLVTEILLSIL